WSPPTVRHRGGGQAVCCGINLNGGGPPPPPFCFGNAQSTRECLTAVAGVLALRIANVLHPDHLLVLCGVEHDHALRRAAGDADVLDRATDQLPPVGHQHDLIGILDGERGDELAVAPVNAHGDDAFSTASRRAVLIGGGAFAVTVL